MTNPKMQIPNSKEALTLKNRMPNVGILLSTQVVIPAKAGIQCIYNIKKINTSGFPIEAFGNDGWFYAACAGIHERPE
jgi:hypothetical protein